MRMMDPQHLHIRKDFKTWNFAKKEKQEEWRAAPDQLQPWQVSNILFKVTMLFKSHHNFKLIIIHNSNANFQEILTHLNLPDVFHGESVPASVFRFPLRSQASDLSSNVFNIR